MLFLYTGTFISQLLLYGLTWTAHPYCRHTRHIAWHASAAYRWFYFLPTSLPRTLLPCHASAHRYLDNAVGEPAGSTGRAIQPCSMA